MNRENSHLEHDHFERLLPWFVNGTLDPEELDSVSRHVSGCKTCERSIAELSAIRTGVQTHPATPIVPEPGVARLMAVLDKNETRGRIGMPYWATAASIGVLVLAMFFYYSSNDRSSQVPQRYETATSMQDSLAMDYVLDVSFAGGLGAAKREEILESFGATDITRSGPEGAYRIVVQIPAASVEELGRFTDRFAATAGVASIEVVALQLPMSRDP